MKQIRSQKSVVIAVSVASTMACSFPSFCHCDVDQGFIGSCEVNNSRDSEDVDLQEESIFKSRLFFACQLVSEFVNKFSPQITAEEMISVSLATYTRQIESYMENNLPRGLKIIMDKLLDISAPNRLIGECHLESVFNLVKKKESEGSPLHQVIAILDPDSLRRMEGYMFLLVKYIPTHFIIMGNVYKEINLYRMNKTFRNNQSSIITCIKPSSIKECVDKLIRNLNNKYSEPELLLENSCTNFSIGGIPMIDVKLLNTGNEQNRLPKFSLIEVVGFLTTSQLNNFIGIGLDERYYLCGSEKSEILHMMALSMTQTSTAAFCMLNREFNEPIFGLLCPIFRGYMADCESKVDELSLLLMILPNESDCDTWKECLNYVAYQANNAIEDSISQKSLLTPWTSWNDAGSFSKDTAMQLKKFALRGLIKELDSEIERILDHASILGHRPHWLIDVLQYCASLSKTEDMAKAITKWAKQIKALYSSSN